MPKWLFPLTEIADEPALDSSRPWARVMLAGTPVRYISLTAVTAYFAMYFSCGEGSPAVEDTGQAAKTVRRRNLQKMSISTSAYKP